MNEPDGPGDPHAVPHLGPRRALGPIAMDDGIVLRADVFRPIAETRAPVILTYGVYAKELAFQEGYPLQWQKMIEDHPEILEGSTHAYQNRETTDVVASGYWAEACDDRFRRVLHRELRIVDAGAPA